MAMMLGALYKALLEAHGISEDTARAAAEEVAAYDSRLGAMDRGLSAMDTKLAVLQALVGLNMTLTLGLLWLVFQQGAQLATIAARVAAIAAKVGVP